MKLRLALKICRELSRDPFTIRPKRTYGQIDQARHIGRKKWRDNRFPYVESDDEIDQRADTIASLFAGIAVQFADDAGIAVPEEIRNEAFDFSVLTETPE